MKANRRKLQKHALRTCLFGSWILCAIASVSCASSATGFPPELLRRVQAYDGPPKERSEVAILFTMDGRPDSESATICEIDGLSLERDGTCASVVHVLPGSHRLKLRYHSRTQFGAGQLRLDAEANRLYQINFSSLRVDYAATVSVIPMYAGAKLSWRNLAPGLAKGSPRIDEEVPYAPNSEGGVPVGDRTVSEVERSIADQLLDCAGKFAVDIDLRKNTHQEYESRFSSVGTFTKAAIPIVGEEAAFSGMRRAQRRGMTTYAAAFSISTIGTEESRLARDRLASDLEKCTDFYQQHRSLFNH